MSEREPDEVRLYGLDEADPTLVWLADRTLITAMLGQHTDAQRLVLNLANRFGTPGVWLAMLLWTDTTLAAAGITPGAHDDDAIRLRFLDVDNGSFAALDDVPAPVMFAGRFLAARAADDPDTGHALVAALPDDPDSVTEALLALLAACAGNLNAMAAPR